MAGLSSYASEQPSGGGGYQGGGYQGGGYQGGGFQSGGYQGGGYQEPAFQPLGWANFLDNYAQVQQANQQNNWQLPSQDTYDGRVDRGSMFQMDRGTEGLYDKWNKASVADQAAITLGNWGRWWNNLPAEIAASGKNGLDAANARQEWTFDANKINPFDGMNDEEWKQARNFAASLPGMMVGGLFEGGEKAYEAVTGKPVQEYRQASDGSWELPDYQLDASQRAAAGLDAAINIAGTFTGGAGRVAGAVGKGAVKAGAKAIMSGSADDIAKMAKRAGRAEAAEEVFDNMSKGVVTRAFEGVKGGKPLGTGAGLLADMGDEAAEEYIQSYADDIRMKTLDEKSNERAMQGALWGAVGGGVMGGAGRAATAVMDHVASRDQNPSTTNPATAQNSIQGDPSGRSSLSKLDGNRVGQGLLNRVANEALEDKLTNDRFAVAATTYKQTGTDKNLLFDRIRLGTSNVVKTFYRDEQSAARVANMLGSDVETLRSIFTQSDDVARDLNALMKANRNGHSQVVVGRNPDTKNGGYYMDVEEFVNGDAFVTHPLVANIVGSDWDGDTSSVYFDPNMLNEDDPEYRGIRLTPRGYVTEMLMDPEGKSNVEWWWAGIMNSSSFDIDKVKAFITDAFAPYVDPDLGSDLTGYYTRSIVQAMNQDEKKRDTALSSVFMNIAKAIDRYRMNDDNIDDMFIDSNGDSYKGRGNQLPSGRRVVNELLNDILNDPETLVQKQIDVMVSNVAERLLDTSGLTEEDLQEYDDILRHWDEVRSEWSLRGTTGGSEKAFQMTKSLHLLAYLIDPDSKYNPIYRQYGELRYMTSSVPLFNDVVTGLADIYGSEPVILNILRSAFRISDSGTSPLSAIEAICDKLLMAEVQAELGMPGFTISSENDYNRFREKFIEVQKKYADLYNRAQKGFTSRGFEPLSGSNYRNAISDLHDESSKESAFQRNLMKTFGNQEAQNVIGEDAARKLGFYGKTFSELLEKYGKFTWDGNIDLLLMPLKDDINTEGAVKLVKSAVNHYGNEQNAIVGRFYEQVKQLKLHGVINRFDGNGKHIAPQDVPSLLNFMDVVHELVGGIDSIMNGFVLSDEFVDSQAGRMLLSGDPNKVANALTSMSLFNAFEQVADVMRSSKNVQARSNAKEKLQELRRVSPVHEIIADEILNDNFETYDYLTSLDHSLDEKVVGVKKLLGNKYANPDYVLNSLQTETGKFALSSVSAKMVKSEQALSQLKKQIYDTIESETNEFFNAIDSTPGNNVQLQEAFTEYVLDRCRFGTMEYSDEIIAMKILASLTLDNSYVEKATIPDIMVALHNAGVIGENGAMMSQLNLITSAQTGVVDKSDWLSNRYHVLACISDPNYRCWVWDQDQRKRVLMTQETLMRSVVPTWSAGTRLDYNTLKALFKKYPQIAGYVCSPTVNVVTKNGFLGVQHARALNLQEDFQIWKRPKTKPNKDLDLELVEHVDNAMKDIRSYIFNMPAAHHIITTMLPDGALEGHVDARALSNQVTKALDQLCAHILYRSMNTPVNPDYTSPVDFIEDKSELKSSVTGQLATTLWNLCAAANERNFNESGTETAISSQLATEFYRNVLYDYLQETTGISGLTHIDDDVSFSGLEKDLNEAYMRTMRIAVYIMKRSAADFAEELDAMKKSLLSVEDIENDIFEALRKAEQNKVAGPLPPVKIDELKKEAHDQAVRALAEDSISIQQAFDIEDDGSLLSLDDFESKAQLTQRLNQLLSWNPRYTEKPANGKKGYIESAIENLDKNKWDTKSKEKLIYNVNNIILEHELSAISALNAMPVNANAVRLADEIEKSLNDLVVSFSAEMKKAGSRYSRDDTTDGRNLVDELRRRGFTPEVPPSFNFFSRTVQSNISQQTVSDASAGNPPKVGTNGMMGKRTYATSHIPKEVTDLKYSYTRPISKSEISSIDLVTEYRSMFAKIPGNSKPVSMASQEFMNYWNGLADTDRIDVYHPDMNAHGLPTFNMETVMFDPRDEYHRISGIIGRIIDFSQEQMVLKTKKLLRSVNKIVNRQDLPTTDEGYIIDTNDGYTVVDKTSITQVFARYREDYIDAMIDEFREGGSMSDLGYGETQARIIVQALTPGMVINAKNVKTGEIKSFVMDASLIINDISALYDPSAESAIDNFLDDIVNGGEMEIVDAEVLSITPSELSARIMQAVNKSADSNGKVAVSDSEAAVVDALGDWSNYDANLGGDVSMLVHSLSPVGYAYTSSIPATDNPTATMWLGDALWDGAFGSVVDTDGGKRLEVYDPENNNDKGPISAGKNLGIRDLFNTGYGTVPVLMAWNKTFNQFNSATVTESERSFNEALGYVKNRPHTGSMIPCCGICTDPYSLNDAVAWARETHNGLFVTGDMLDTMRAFGDNIVREDLEVETNSGITLYFTTPHRGSRFFVGKEKHPHGAAQVADTRKIMACGIVSPDHEVLGDAEIRAFKQVWNFVTKNSNHREVDIDGNVFQHSFDRKAFVPKSQVDEILNKVADYDITSNSWVARDAQSFIDAGFRFDSEYIKNAGKSGLIGKSTMELRDLIVRYLVDMKSSDGDPDSYESPNPQKATVAAILHDDSGNMVPVLYPADMPGNLVYSAVYIDNGTICFDYSGTTRIIDDDVYNSVKFMLQGETFKGMISKAMRDAPKIAGGGNLGFLASSDTEGSRVGGMDEILTLRALYYTMKQNDFSLFFSKTTDKDGNIKYDLSDKVKGWPERYRTKLVNQQAPWDDDMIDAIISGRLELGSNDTQNLAIRTVFKTLKRSHINPFYLFSNYRLVPETDGNGNFVRYRRENFAQSFEGDNSMYMECDWQLALSDVLYDPDLYFSLFHAVDKSLCPNGMQDTSDRSNYIIGKNGTALVDFYNNGEYAEIPVRMGFHQVLTDQTQETVPSGFSSVAQQHTGRRGMDIGYRDDTIEGAVPYNNLSIGYYNEAIDSIKKRRDKMMARKPKEKLEYEKTEDLQISQLVTTASYKELSKLSKVKQLVRNTFKHQRVIYDNDGNNLLDRKNKDLFEGSRLYGKISAFNQLVDDGHQWNIYQIDALTKCLSGTSWTGKSSEESTGAFRISEAKMCDQIDELMKNIREGKLPVYVKWTDSSKNDGRFPMALLPPEVARWVWDSFEYIRNDNHGNYREFVAAMKVQQDRSEQAIASIAVNRSPKLRKKQAELIDFARALRLSWRDTSTVLPVFEDITIERVKDDTSSLANTLSSVQGWSAEQRQLFDQLCDASDEQIKAVRMYLEKMHYGEVMFNRGNGTESSVYTKVDEARDLTNLLNNAAELSKVMAILNPMLTAGNLLDRMFHQTFARGALNLGRYFRIGPYKAQKDHYVDTKIIDKAVNDPMGLALYQALREAEFNSEDAAFLETLVQNGDIEAILDFTSKHKEKAGAFGKVCDFAYKAASGGSLGIKQQMRTVIDHFVRFAEANGQDFWFEPSEVNGEDGKPLTRLEAMLASPYGFSNFMTFCLGAGGRATPSYQIFQNAMNAAKAGDIAQKNAVGLVLGHICRKVPYGKFWMTTCVSRFPMYGLNVTGRLANYILPISTMNYAFTNILGKTELGKQLNVEGTQIHTSMREAVIVDLCKLGVGGVAIALFGISGAIQPPDDERKWGNIDEWLVFGARAGESWWLEDVLGMALPLACFWKACDLGKPRFDIITNGIANACYANPLLRVDDIAEWLLNPAESLVRSYDEEVEQYSRQRGGVSYAQYIQSKYFSLGMSWLGQFVTPSIVKEWYRASGSLEKSAKRVYSKSASGRETEKGVYGATEYTTYDDAKKRQLAKKNPVLAALFTVTSGTSYFAWDMPNTVYYDDAQLEGNNITTVAGLEGEERIAKVVQLISIMEAYDDMDELAADGFHLDDETMRAVAQQVWDNYHSVDEWYYDLQSSGQLDFYTAGNGDWSEGQRIVGEINKERQTMKQYWYDFYNQKLKQTAIVAPLQAYNRYNTTYAQDVNGNVYATGILRSPFNVMPVEVAPGFVDNPDGTAGYENDFVSVSAVTNRPMSQRALIPVNDSNRDLPDLESWSADGNGDSYSKQHKDIYGDSSKTPTGKDTTTTTTTTKPTGTSRYPSRGGGGYGGSGGRGGSGGKGGSGGRRGYTQNIGAPNARAPITSGSLPRANLSKANPSRIMNTDRLVDPNQVYLRPDFETKGSREAYKRSDI